MSVVYEIRCGKCNCDLTFSEVLDRQGDLCVEVEPCPDCLKEKYEEGLQVGKEEGE